MSRVGTSVYICALSRVEMYSSCVFRTGRDASVQTKRVIP